MNCVEMLYVTLLPFVKQSENNEIKIIANEFEAKLEELDSKINKEIQEQNKSYKSKIAGTNRVTDRNMLIEESNSMVSYLENKRELEKVKIYKKLLKMISYLLVELNYLGEGGIMAG